MRFRFGEYLLDTDTLELLHGNVAVDVEPQVFSVLAHLVRHRERVVTKEELLDEVWGDRFVSESALTTRIKQARAAVGDSGQRQAVIKTLHGRGYRFVAPVDDAATLPAEPSAAPYPAVTPVPPTRYAESGGASIAYQTFGDGPDLVLIAGFATNVEVQWEHPSIAAFLRRLGSFSRVTVLDKRGVGLSERMPRDDPPSLEVRADDLRAVMDAAAVRRATVLGSSEGGSLAIVFTASHPERVERLVLHGTWARHPHYPQRPARDLELVDRTWGQGEVYASVGPSLAATPPGREFLARYERQSATPRTARLLRELTAQIDVSDACRAISVPTLILHRTQDSRIPFERGEDLARRIVGARLVPLEGSDHHLFSGDTGPLLDEIERFVTGAQHVPVPDHVLATVLVVDIAGADGDRAHVRDVAAHVVEKHRGVLVATPDGRVVATFDGPGRAVRAAAAVRDAVGSLGLRARCGVHTAEIQRRGDGIAGVGVDIARLVAAAAPPGEVWVSRTVTDLVAGTGLTFASRGAHDITGLDEPWTLYAAGL